jgi:putative ABC transport system permease protein
MFKNYIKVAFRNLWRNKSFSAINVFGLAIGLAICLLITLFVFDELSYDRFNTKADRIYRVNSDFKVNGSLFNDRSSAAPMGATLVKEYPQIEDATRLVSIGRTLVKKDNETLTEPNTFYADPNLFNIFTIPMITGDPKTALVQPNSIVISESLARKYFSTTDVIGKTLHLDNTADYKITGVIKNMPAQSHLHFNLIKAMSGYANSRQTGWLSEQFDTYLLTRPGVTQLQVDDMLKQVTKKYSEPELKNYLHSSIADLEQKGDHYRFVSIPLTKIHLYSTTNLEVEPTGNIQYVYIFMVIAVFILLVACINFMNLSTARSAGRSKEVGVRKVLGSGRGNLISQFLVESVITSFIASAMGLFIAALLLPYFNQLAGKQITFGLISSAWLLPVLCLIALIVGLLAGSYPAFFLSAFQPIQVLKGKLASGFKGSVLRNTLVVFQFSTVIILIVGTLVIYSQLNYIRNKDLGYNRDQVLIIQNTASLYTHAKVFKHDVLKIEGVKSGTITGNLPTSTLDNTQVYSRDAAQSPGQVFSIQTLEVDEGYFPALEMKIVKGRNFSAQIQSDSTAMIINETAAKLLGYQEPLNKSIYEYTRRFNVIGVVKDFNTGSLRSKIPPMVFMLGNNRGAMAFRVEANKTPSIISQIETLYHSADAKMAGQPFQYNFMDDEFNRIYQSEQNTGKIFVSFAFFAILIACLGLFGLVTYAAEQRTKEIGIRKVLGASAGNIVAMLSNDFLKLIGIAAIISAPVAWYAMNKWLQDFAYHTSINLWVFVVAGVLAVLITIVTVSFRAIKAALTNPVISLRSE